MAKKLVAQNFSFRAKYYRRGTEVDDSAFAPDVLKAFTEQGKLVAAGGNAAQDIKNDQTVQDVSAANARAAAIINGDHE